MNQPKRILDDKTQTLEEAGLGTRALLFCQDNAA